MFRALLPMTGNETAGAAVPAPDEGRSQEDAAAAIRYRAWSQAVEACLHTGRDYRDLDPWLDRFGDGTGFEDCPQALRGVVRGGLFQALHLRRPDDGRLPALAEAIADDLYRASRVGDGASGLPRAVLANRLMTYFVWGGDLAAAAPLAAWVRHALAAGPRGTVAAALWASEALYAWASGGGARAAEAVDAGLAVAGSAPEWRFQLHAHAAYAALCRRDDERIHRHLDALRGLAADGGTLESGHYHMLASLATLAEGDYAEAAEHTGIALVLARRLGAPLIDGFARLGLCRIAVERGEAVAGELLREVGTLASRCRNRLLEHLTLLLEARHSLEGGQRRRATAQVRRAFDLVRRYGVAGLPWWGERSLTFACETALRAGVERDFVRGLIERHRLVPHSADIDDWPHRLRIYTLGRFSVVCDAAPVRFDRKPQRRPMDLLKVLVALGGRDVPVDRVCAILWPEAEGDAAHHAFETALYRLRRLIGIDAAVTVAGGRLSLDNRHCWVDVWAFERVLSRIDRLVHGRDTGRRRERLAHLMDRALELYHGDFLGAEAGESWTIRLRERLRSKFVRRLAEIGAAWEAMQEWDRAAACYEKGLDVDDLVEVFHQRLIACHAALGRKAEALVAYRRCRRTLSLVLGIAPSAETEGLLRRVLRAPTVP